MIFYILTLNKENAHIIQQMVSFFGVDSKCHYKILPHAVSKEFSGETVETRWLTRNEKISDCQAYCDTLPNCYSFNYQRDPKKCYFKDRKLTGNEPLMCREDYFTVYKKCSQGI